MRSEADQASSQREHRERRVLVVDDDEVARNFVTMALAFEGIAVDAAVSPHDGRERLGLQDYDCVVLDVDMPTGSGISFLRDLRRDHDVAVVMLSACDDSAFAVVALEAGADDYCVKPISDRELVLRVDLAVARHTARPAEQATADIPVVLAFEGLVIDPYCRIAVVDGQEVELTAREFDVLVAMASQPGRVFSRQDLLKAVWDAEPEWQSLDTVTEHIYRLRQKLDPPQATRSWIHTLRGAGYRFDWRRPAVEAASTASSGADLEASRI